ncbi:MAG: hypothetical protein AB8B55_21925 [Mariniblastus sp.]
MRVSLKSFLLFVLLLSVLIGSLNWHHQLRRVREVKLIKRHDQSNTSDTFFKASRNPELIAATVAAEEKQRPENAPSFFINKFLNSFETQIAKKAKPYEGRSFFLYTTRLCRILRDNFEQEQYRDELVQKIEPYLNDETHLEPLSWIIYLLTFVDEQAGFDYGVKRFLNPTKPDSSRGRRFLLSRVGNSPKKWLVQQDDLLSVLRKTDPSSKMGIYASELLAKVGQTGRFFEFYRSKFNENRNKKKDAFGFGPNDYTAFQLLKYRPDDRTMELLLSGFDPSWGSEVFDRMFDVATKNQPMFQRWHSKLESAFADAALTENDPLYRSFYSKRLCRQGSDNSIAFMRSLLGGPFEVEAIEGLAREETLPDGFACKTSKRQQALDYVAIALKSNPENNPDDLARRLKLLVTLANIFSNSKNERVYQLLDRESQLQTEYQSMSQLLYSKETLGFDVPTGAWGDLPRAAHTDHASRIEQHWSSKRHSKVSALNFLQQRIGKVASNPDEVITDEIFENTNRPHGFLVSAIAQSEDATLIGDSVGALHYADGLIFKLTQTAQSKFKIRAFEKTDYDYFKFVVDQWWFEIPVDSMHDELSVGWLADVLNTIQTRLGRDEERFHIFYTGVADYRLALFATQEIADELEKQFQLVRCLER